MPGPLWMRGKQIRGERYEMKSEIAIYNLLVGCSYRHFLQKNTIDLDPTVLLVFGTRYRARRTEVWLSKSKRLHLLVISTR